MFSRFLLIILFCIPLQALWAPVGFAASDEASELQTRIEVAHVGGKPWAVVWLDIRSDYHAYANTPSGTGKPTELSFSPMPASPKGKSTTNGSAARVHYPAGKSQKDVFSPAITVQVYEGSVPLFVELGQLRPGQELKGSLELLLCSSKHCLPVQRSVAVRLPTTALPAMDELAAGELWKQTVHGGGAAQPPAAMAAVPVSADGGGASALQQADTGEWVLSPRPMQEELEVASLGKALLLGLLAGILLNFMPCVLPVLTLKSSAMLVVGDGDREQRLRQFREHNLLFAAGIMTQFLLLALILGGAGLIWGQLFQSSALVTGMLIIVFLLGLSMLGLFTLPVIDLKAGSSSSPRLNAYLTGMMATFLATPCSGPLLGGVLSWAFTQPLAVLVVVFLAVGAGMSVPYLIFAARPGLATFLPRPGAWMALLERGVGFFLLGTALYLLSILPQDRHLPLLTALLVVAMGGWIWGQFGGYGAPPLRRKLLGGGLAVLTLATVLFASRPPEPLVTWEPFSRVAVREAMGKEALLVEFTADWCPNCKFLEQTVLTQQRLRRWQQKYGFKLVRVDLTRKDAEAEAFLQALGSSSIPLMALFPRGLSASSPVVLRDIYSVKNLEQALRRAFAKGTRP